MTFRTWSILAKPGDMSYEGMMHTYKMHRLCNSIWTRYPVLLIAWCIDCYLFKLNRIYIRVRYLYDR